MKSKDRRSAIRTYFLVNTLDHVGTGANGPEGDQRYKVWARKPHFQAAFHSFPNKQIGNVARPVRDRKQTTILSLEANIYIQCQP